MEGYLSREELENELVCPVCLDLFHTPRLFNCGHSVCTECINVYIKANGVLPGSIAQCPICRKQTLIPREGVIGLPKNIHVANLVDKMRTSPNLRFSQLAAPQPSAPPLEEQPVALPQALPSQNQIKASQIDMVPLYQPASISLESTPELIKKWRAALWFAPSDLPTQVPLSHIQFIMVPYWVCDASYSANFTAKVRDKVSTAVPVKDSDKKAQQPTERPTTVVTKSEVGERRKLILAVPRTHAEFAFIAKYHKAPAASIRIHPAPTPNAPIGSVVLPTIDWNDGLMESIQGELKNEYAWTFGNQLWNKEVVSSTTTIAFTKFSRKLIYIPAYLGKFVYKETTYAMLIDAQDGQVLSERPRVCSIL